MKILSFVVCLLLMSYSISIADTQAAPLQLQAPNGWNVDYKGGSDRTFYRVKDLTGHTAFMFSRWPGDDGADKIPTLLDGMANKMLSNPNIKYSANTYTKGDFKGDAVSGNFVILTLPGGLNQIFFMFSDGTQLWNGQYMGSAEGWNDSLTILKSIKKNIQ